MIACPFCDIPANQSEPVAASNDHCYLIHNPEGSLPHGMMVIPFRHVETPFDLSPEEWMSLRPLAQQARDLLDQHAPDGFNLGWNVGKVGGQEVMHAHLHIFPRYADEPFAGMGIRKWFKSSENRRPN